MAKQKNISRNDSEENAPEQISVGKMELVCRKIIHVLEAEKLFLKSDLSVWELSRAVGCGVHDISRSINRYMGKNYFDLINRLRLEEAKRLLRETAEKQLNLNVEDIIRKSGFRSRSTFFANFGEYEKMTPKKYMSLYTNNGLFINK